MTENIARRDHSVEKLAIAINETAMPQAENTKSAKDEIRRSANHPKTKRAATPLA